MEIISLLFLIGGTILMVVGIAVPTIDFALYKRAEKKTDLMSSGSYILMPSVRAISTDLMLAGMVGWISGLTLLFIYLFL